MTHCIRDQGVVCDHREELSADRRETARDLSDTVHRDKLCVGTWKDEKVRLSFRKALNDRNRFHFLTAHHIHGLKSRKIQLSVTVLYPRNKEDRKRAYVLDQHALCSLCKVFGRCRSNHMRDLHKTHVGGDHSGGNDFLHLIIGDPRLFQNFFKAAPDRRF